MAAVRRHMRCSADTSTTSVYKADQNKLDSLKAADFALLVVLSWPQAAYAELRILAFCAVWIFNWDEEADEPAETQVDSVSGVTSFKETTTKFLAASLGLSPFSNPADLQNHRVALNSFGVVGSALRNKLSPDQRARFFTEWQTHVDAITLKQRFCHDNLVPTFGEYWQFRAGTSAVRVMLALVQYAGQLSLPDVVFESAAMKKAWKEVTNIISATKDLFSLRNDVLRGRVDNFVVLHSHSHGLSADDSIREAVCMVRESKTRFEAAANEMIADFAWSPPVREQLRKYLEICQSLCVGNLLWR